MAVSLVARRLLLSTATLLPLLGVLTNQPALAQTYDVVISNGRVRDPESRLDGVRDAGISNSRVIALALAVGMAGPAGSAEGWDAALGDTDALFRKFATETHAPGLVYGVVRDGRLVHVQGFGVQDISSRTPVSADTVFRIASLTKSFTALAVLKLRDQGRLDLDAPATGLVPELKSVSLAGNAAGPIRLRQLLTHTAGWVTDDPWGDRQLDLPEPAFSDLLAQGIPLARTPGEAFEYSNTGYAVLGRVISNVSGQRYQDYISQVLLRPLGMASTFWERRDAPAARRAVGYSWVDDHLEEQPSLSDGAFGAVAGLSTTAHDYARFVAWLLSAWSARPNAVADTIDAATVREAGRGTVLSQIGQRANGPDGKTCPVAWMYGAGFYVVSDCELGTMLRHPGGLPGFGSQVLLLPRAGVGIFAFANLTYAHLSDPVVEAAVHLKRTGLLAEPTAPLSAPLARAAAAALRIYRAGDVGVALDELAANVLLDRPAAQRNAALRRSQEVMGTCMTVAPTEVRHALGGRFELTCEHGQVDVTILLAPTSPPQIQYLEFEPRPPPARQ